MLHLPDPVHPFAVHFPMAFLLLGAAAIGLSLLWPNRYIVRLAFLCMLLGALGATWAHRTGTEEAAAIRYVGESTAAAVQEHKGVSDLMLVASWIAAVAAAAVFFINLIRYQHYCCLFSCFSCLCSSLAACIVRSSRSIMLVRLSNTSAILGTFSMQPLSRSLSPWLCST
jgi:uncharacterized membrane protein